MANVVFSHDNAIIKIYEEDSGGIRGNALTEDWILVQGINCVETPIISTKQQLFAGYNREVVTGYNRSLSIDKYHSSKSNDWVLAIIRNQLYWIEIVFTEYNIDAESARKGASGPQTETYTLKHCTYDGQTLTTGDINTLAKKWRVGEIV